MQATVTEKYFVEEGFANFFSAVFYRFQISQEEYIETRMWANAHPDGRPAKHRWRPLFNAAKFG